MFYETAQTVGPGWHSRSYKPAHYEEMSWSPDTRHFRSPGASPETYRRIIYDDDDGFPRNRPKRDDDDEFFSGRSSPTFPRRVFREVWNESSPSTNHRFTSDRPRMFKRVFRPNQWEDEFDRDVQNARRVERDFDKEFPSKRDFDKEFPKRDFDKEFPSKRDFDKEFPKRDFDKEFPSKRDFDKEFPKRDFDKEYPSRDLKRDFDKDFASRVHHIPILVERRMEEMKSKFGNASSPQRPSEQAAEDADEWVSPGVQNLKKNFEPEKESSAYTRYRSPRCDNNYKPRAFTSPILNDTWDPHRVHTLPTRRSHRSSQDSDDSRHAAPPKPVFRSYSETHEDLPKQQPHHSAAFRSHSDGHCPNQTYVTKIEVNVPADKERDTMRAKYAQSLSEDQYGEEPQRTRSGPPTPERQNSEEGNPVQKSRSTKFTGDHSPSVQQINVVLQNVEDLFKWVEAYNGTGRDKQYRFLDEMLTRCMLRLDDVDTEGREDIRSARKAAVRQVQLCIEKLETKADESERRKQRAPVETVDNPDTSSDAASKEAKTNIKEEDKEAIDTSDELKLPAVIPLPPAAIPLPPCRSAETVNAERSSDCAPKSEEAIAMEESSVNDNEQTKL